MSISTFLKSALFLALVAGLGIAVLFTIRMQDGWSYTIVHSNLEQVSGLIVADADIYVTLETRQQDGQLIRLTADGRQVLVTGLQKPDGLVFTRGQLVYTQESGIKPVNQLAVKDADGTVSKPVALFEANNAEGADSNEAGDIFVIEDRRDGRLLRFDARSRLTQVLKDQLIEPEGLCVASNNRIYYTEKTLGTVYRLLENGEALPIIEGLTKPGYLYCNESSDGIWITEDRRHLGRLLFLEDENAELKVIAESLASPQSIAFVGDDILLAEQGRNRVIRLSRQSHRATEQL